MSEPDKPRWSLAAAAAVAADMLARMRPGCVSGRIIAAGSVRRKKPLVSDVEILFVPAYASAADPADLFGAPQMRNRANELIDSLVVSGVLEKRKNVNGLETYGEFNKLMRHTATGIPVDLFATTEEKWFNALVMRTGPADLNVRIAQAARIRGWKWNPYGVGFTRLLTNKENPEQHQVTSEEDLFRFVGMKCLPPEGRI